MTGALLDIALVHYPVFNRRREVIGSAVTNLDIHDIARTARTYGVNGFYLVTPFEEQHRLVAELLAHWLSGRGGELNPARKEALELVKVVPDLATLYRQVGAKRGVGEQAEHGEHGGSETGRPLVLATSAQHQEPTMEFGDGRRHLQSGQSALLLFGTAWGLAPEALAGVDAFLPPIVGAGDYNHLPVRSAVAIILDRLLH